MAMAKTMKTKKQNTPKSKPKPRPKKKGESKAVVPVTPPGQTLNGAAILEHRVPSENASPSFFEGTEKRIEIDFVPSDGKGLFALSYQHWEEVVKLSATQILKHRQTEAFQSFVLSESSLIVYPFKVILKTCGRTVPIESLQRIIKLGRSVGSKAEWCSYSRKNFLQPTSQPHQHRSFDQEVRRCQEICGCGAGFVLGPVTGDHWLYYNAEFIDVDGKNRYDLTLHLMMYDLPNDVRLNFYDSHSDGAKGMTAASGLGGLAASLGGEIEDTSFEPCGYSCNAHIGDSYFMVHVTPEEEFSYASFETNLGGYGKDGSQRVDLKEVLRKVLDIFRPGKFTMTLCADDGSMDRMGLAPFETAARMYKQRTLTTYHFETDYSIAVANFVDRGQPRCLSFDRST